MRTWSLDFQPFCSTWTLLIGLVLAAVVLVVLFRRERSWLISTLRVAALVLMVLIAMQTTLVQTTLPETDVWILLDDSDSMKLPSNDSWTDGAASRLEQAQGLIQKIQPPLQANQTVHVRKLSELTQTHDGSPLGNALEQLSQTAFDASGHYPAALVLLSDGVSTEGVALPEAGTLAKKQATRVFPIALGSAKPLSEIRLDAQAVSRTTRNTLTSGESLTLSVPLTFRRLEKAEAHIRLSLNGETLTDATLELSAPSDDWEWHTAEPTTLTWTPPQAGTYTLWLEAEVKTTVSTETPLARTFLQDRLPLEIHVAEHTRRVFLASMEPSWEFRYLQNLLKREPSLEVETWLASASEHWSEQDQAARSTFPTADELATFDAVVLFADLPADKLETAAQNAIADFARQAGKALVCIANPDHQLETWRGTPLEKCLPFSLTGLTAQNTSTTGGVRLAPTALGLTTSGFSWGATPAETLQLWQSQPLQYRFVQIPHLHSDCQILAEFQPAGESKPQAVAIPAILRAPLDRGRLLFHAFDSTWRWRWRNDETGFRHYWVQTLHELCQPASTTEPSQIPSPTATQGTTAPPRSALPETPASQRPVEFQRTNADHEALQQLATQSGGRLYTPQDEKTLAADITLTLQTRSTLADQQLEAQHRRFPLWRHPLVFVGLFLLLFSVWVLERRRL